MTKPWHIKDLSIVRSPLLPLSFYSNFLEKEERPEKILELVIKNNFIKEAIYFANPTLANELEKYPQKSNKKKRNIITALYKYLSRMSTKPIPFGLFAGVQEAEFVNSPVFLDNMEKEKEFQRYIRVDFNWLLEIVKTVESQEQLWDYISVKFSNLYLEEGDRIFFPYTTGYGNSNTYNNENQVKEFSIRKNELVNIIKFQTEEDYIPLSSLVSNLIEQYKDIGEDKIKNYLKNLIKNEILITNLRPNLTTENNMLELLAFFERNKLTRELIYRNLLDIQNKIIEYSKIGREDTNAEGLLINLQDEMQKIYISKNYLHIDLKALGVREIPTEYKSDLEEMLDIISLFLIGNSGNNNIIPFKNAFLEKYGYNTEINLLDLLYSLEFMEYSTVSTNSRELINKDAFNLIESLINNALFQGHEEIVLTDVHINNLKNKNSVNKAEITESFDLIVSISEQKNNTVFTLNPSIFTDNSGQLIGRFFYLLSERFKEEAATIKNFEKNIYGENYEIPEVSCQSVYGRASNISSTINVRDYELPILTGLSNTKPNLNIKSIYCGINNSGQLYLRNIDSGKLIIPKTTNMLHGTKDFPEIYRFLLDINMEDKIAFQPFFPLLHEKFVFTPRIRYKNFVLSKKHWRIDLFTLGLEEKFSDEDWESAIFKWRNIYKVPKNIELKNGDSTIYFNLDNTLHLKILKKEFSRFKKLKFTEVDISSDNSSFENKGYREEITLSIFNNNFVKKNFISSISTIPTKRKLTPGDEWIYYKIYIKECYQDEFLIKVILPAMSSLLEKNDIISYFYIRYFDSRPHIRLRLNAEPLKINELFNHINNLLNTYINSNLIDSVTIDTYYPEYSRYGGEELQLLTHEIFYADSLYSVKLLEINNQIGESIENIIIHSIIDMLDGFGLTKEKQINLIRKSLNRKGNKTELNKEIKAINFNANPELQKVSELRALKIKRYSEALEKKHLLEDEIANIILSFIHMNVNRMMIINREKEDQIMLKLLNFKNK